MCDCYSSSCLSSLRLPDYRSWSRSQRRLLLLCQLCGQRRNPRRAGPQVNAGGNREEFGVCECSLWERARCPTRAASPTPYLYLSPRFLLSRAITEMMNYYTQRRLVTGTLSLPQDCSINNSRRSCSHVGAGLLPQTVRIFNALTKSA